MAFDQTTRNRLQKFVTQARGLLSDEFARQLQNDYGMDPDTGTVSDIERLTHLNDAKYQTAALLRDTLAHYHSSSPDSDPKEILARIVREQAFTVLNRLCALRMAEARGILIESISSGYQSKGFQLYGRVAGPSLGNTGNAYKNYLFSVFDEFALDLAVLFDRYSPMGRLFPKESVLLDLLDHINDVDLEPLWAEDETIGWIYQYFNSAEERRQMRAESQAPRNTRELAVRNQFFTPRYVVEFLTDNTLGRIWYEMIHGKTALKDQCRYLVRRPNEIFLSKGVIPPEQAEPDADLTQEELLQLPVYIEHRPLKDPREILMLDPACGSMHFGLYAFDLFEKIYEEAWDFQASGQWQGEKSKKFRLLTETYSTREVFQADIPRLIIENNIHGIDIDPRAVQIAGLSLWLRAQRSWQKQQIPAGKRPEIRKAHIVCAESMPGETEMLRTFSETLKPRVLGQLVEIIFEKMSLAGEAGSLLKIEEEIEEAIENAREAFNQELVRRKDEAGYLPGMAPKVRQRELFDFADLPDKTQFWKTAEEKILEALKGYAEKAEEENVNRRRLFAEDAAKGFAFIDLCRKRYDVVLMNPPFGDFTINSRKSMYSSYSISKRNILCSFIERGVELLKISGKIGAITSRTPLFTISFKEWREKVFFGNGQIELLSDLGGGILDNAMVETCTYILGKQLRSSRSSSFIAVDIQSGKINSQIGICSDKIINIMSSNLFKLIPGFPIAFWASKELLFCFKKFMPFEGNYGTARQGLGTGDDFRFTRAFFEVSNRSIGLERKFVRYSLGGSFHPYFEDLPVIVNWANNGKEMKAYEMHRVDIEGKPARGNGPMRECEYYFSPGLFFPRRTKSLCTKVLPGNCIFSVGGQAIFTKKENLYGLQGLLSSSSINSLCELMLGNLETGSQYEVGVIKRLPIASEILEDPTIRDLSKKIVALIVRAQQMVESSSLFNGDFLFERHLCVNELLEKISVHHNRLLSDAIGYQMEIENQCTKIYGNAKTTISYVKSFMESSFQFNKNNFFHSILSYFWGCIIGRWDIRYAIGKKEIAELPEPFEQLPASPPGMLQNDEGFPVEPKDVSEGYPLRISWPGIIVDDEGHPEDILTRIREAMEVIWKDKANDIEQEACEILGVRTLQEYFSKSSKFFADHLKRYSKSRRQAPIYWPLSIPSGSYTLWLYYHRLTDQILYTCVNNFVGPKLKQVSEDVVSLQKKFDRTRKEETELENLSVLSLELTEFQEELLRIAQFWKPNLNDGVQITAAPLWKLFQHKPWQKKLKQTWKDLEKGKYDWAHLACSIWPERVIRASHKDRSYAIAHDLEEELWQEIETGTDRQGNVKTKWVSKKLSEKELKAIIEVKIRMRHHVD